MRKNGSQVTSILLIDDDLDDYDLLREALQDIDPNITVHFLSRCEEGAKYQWQSFDLVLLDINMPYHDGFSWLNGIRKHGYDKLPIVMYTNSLSPADIVKSYKHGANLYFPKPDSFSKLRQALQKLIQLDWSDPFSITQRFIENGKYLTFQAE
jgi:CheY-like chemotaxis protein